MLGRGQVQEGCMQASLRMTPPNTAGLVSSLLSEAQLPLALLGDLDSGKEVFGFPPPASGWHSDEPGTP